MKAGGKPGGSNHHKEAVEPPTLEWALSMFPGMSVKDIELHIKSLGQKDLQMTYNKVYRITTKSNNNDWLRRKLSESVGIKSPKAKPKKAKAKGKAKGGPAKGRVVKKSRASDSSEAASPFHSPTHKSLDTSSETPGTATHAEPHSTAHSSPFTPPRPQTPGRSPFSTVMPLESPQPPVHFLGRPNCPSITSGTSSSSVLPLPSSGILPMPASGIVPVPASGIPPGYTPVQIIYPSGHPHAAPRRSITAPCTPLPYQPPHGTSPSHMGSMDMSTQMTSPDLSPDTLRAAYHHPSGHLSPPAMAPFFPTSTAFSPRQISSAASGRCPESPRPEPAESSAAATGNTPHSAQSPAPRPTVARNHSFPNAGSSVTEATHHASTLTDTDTTLDNLPSFQPSDDDTVFGNDDDASPLQPNGVARVLDFDFDMEDSPLADGGLLEQAALLSGSGAEGVAAMESGGEKELNDGSSEIHLLDAALGSLLECSDTEHYKRAVTDVTIGMSRVGSILIDWHLHLEGRPPRYGQAAPL